MFQKARLKLTVWYLSMLMLISVVFSIVIFNIVSFQIQGLIHDQNNRLRHYEHDIQEGENPPPPSDDGAPIISTQDTQEQENQLLLTLIIVNSVIFVIAGGASYFLAGRTLLPIKLMIEEQNQFISHASHQLRTPIAAMRIDIEGSLLEKHISDQRARDIAKSNLEELGSLQTVTNKLIRLAQVPQDNAQIITRKISLNKCIQAACRKVASLAKKKQINIRQHSENVFVNGDDTDLIEAIVTLLENAIKYSPEHTSVTITTNTVKDSVFLLIADEGHGIEEKDLPHIFTRFYRSAQAYPQEGFGLGLSIAKKIIEAHKGTIQVTSVVNKGTTFTISLPLTKS